MRDTQSFLRYTVTEAEAQGGIDLSNLFDYLTWRDDLTLAQSPFNEVDGAILARVSYFPFDLISLSEESAITLGEAAVAFLSVPDMQQKVLFREDYPLMEALAESPRFKDMKLLSYRNTFDTENEIQFSAVTLQLAEELYYVSFRGTDNTLIGWKENFNMGFDSPVPAQLLAVDYLRALADRLPGQFLLGGHSKGGNLAVYAGAFCDEELQSRVTEVYNFDGPGFDAKLMGQPGYDAVCGRVHTLIPQSSVVEMLLEHEEEYTIVHSTQMGLLQHDIYSWEVERDRFIHLETVTDGSLFVDRTVKDWVAGMDYDRREAFVEAVYGVLSETNARTLREMNENRVGSTLAVLRSLKEMDEPTRKLVSEVVLSLLRSAGEVFSRWARGGET